MQNLTQGCLPAYQQNVLVEKVKVLIVQYNDPRQFFTVMFLESYHCCIMLYFTVVDGQ